MTNPLFFRKAIKEAPFTRTLFSSHVRHENRGENPFGEASYDLVFSPNNTILEKIIASVTKNLGFKNFYSAKSAKELEDKMLSGSYFAGF